MPRPSTLTAAEVVGRLAATSVRTAASDGERRAANWLRDALRARGHAVSVQAVWVRPGWASAHAGHCALAVAGSIASASGVALPGLAVLGVTFVSLAADLSGTLHLLRALVPARATQNLIAGGIEPAAPGVHLVLTANLDAGRAGAVYRDGWVRAESRLRRALGGRLPSPLALLALAVLALVAIAAARLARGGGTALGAIQLVPTVVVLIGFAALVDIALANPSPGANANASGVAAALATFDALAEAPARSLQAQLVLAGAGEAPAAGITAFLADRRRHHGWRSQDVVVIAFEPCGRGAPRWWTHDGVLPSLALHPQLNGLTARLAAANPQLGARPHRGHGSSGAWAARRRRWPAIAIGALDAHERPGPARQAGDVAAGVQEPAIAATVELALALVRALDRELTRAAGVIS